MVGDLLPSLLKRLSEGNLGIDTTCKENHDLPLLPVPAVPPCAVHDAEARPKGAR